MFLMLIDLYDVSLTVDFEVIKNAGTMAKIIHGIPTQMAKVLVATSGFENNS